MSRSAKIRHFIVSAVVVAALVVASIFIYPRLLNYFESPKAKIGHAGSELFGLKDENTLVVSEKAMKAIDLKTVLVKPAPEPDPLLLPGYLSVDPSKLIPVHSRFSGEVVHIGRIDARDANGKQASRFLRYGDPVKQGDVLAVVWSTDIGQKKSELVDALSKYVLDQRLLDNLRKAGSAVSGREIAEARRAAEADRIAILSAKRTLISWRLTEDEVAIVEREAEQLRQESPQTAAAETWAELEIRAPMDGVILEKNVNVGEIVETTDNLFKIGDLTRIQVLAYVYEEDLPTLEQLEPSERHWKIDLKSDPNDLQRPGMFELIGDVIDSVTRTGPVIGWIDNQDRRLRVNQFVTATINMPADPTMVAVPTSALIEEGGTEAVFVETDPKRHEVARRVVAVTRRGKDDIFIRSEPNEQERQEGAQPLAVGERVVMRGGLELDSELRNLQSSGGEN
jgi:membrane fusion protein, heavy metal efflux system